MSATNTTTYYEFPVFVGSDKPAWLVDWNGAMNSIDSAIHEAKAEADANASSISSIQSDVSSLAGSVSSQGSSITTLTQSLTSLQGTVNTITSLIGNGEPTTTDKTIIGAINEVNGKVGEKVVAYHAGIDIVADGVKTNATLLAEALTAFNAVVSSKPSTHIFTIVGGALPYSTMIPTELVVVAGGSTRNSFSASHIALWNDASKTVIYNANVNVNAGNCKYGSLQIIHSDGSVIYTDLNSTVPASGTHVTIIYDEHERYS